MRKFGEKVETRAKKRNDRVRGGERRRQHFLFSPPLSPSILFFCSCSNFCAFGNACYAGYATKNGTLLYYWACTVHWRVAEEGWGGVGTTLWPKQSILLPRLCGPKSFQDQPLLSKTSQRMVDIFIFSFQEDLFAKSTFFLLAFSHKNVEQIQWHITITLRKKYSPGKKTPLEKDKVSILCTHPFFCDSYLLLLPPAAFLALPCKKNCTQEQSFLFSTLILRPALKNNLKNCSQPRSFSKRRDMPLP